MHLSEQGKISNILDKGINSLVDVNYALLSAVYEEHGKSYGQATEEVFIRNLLLRLFQKRIVLNLMLYNDKEIYINKFFRKLIKSLIDGL